ncbi:MAG: hypothetical protein ABW088_05910 [Sedimenticola sp.]
MKKIIQSASLLIFSVVISILLAEAIARTVNPVPTKIMHFETNALEWNEFLGNNRFKKNSISIQTNGHFFADIFIDTYGTRVNSKDDINRKLSVVSEIAIAIGDSQTFGHGIANQDTWPSQLSKINAETILNFGVPGYGVYQYDRLIKSNIKKFNVTKVYIGLTDNDLCSATSENYKPNSIAKKQLTADRSHLNYLKRNTSEYLSRYTSIGNLISKAHQNFHKIKNSFSKTSIGSYLKNLKHQMTGSPSNKQHQKDQLSNGECLSSIARWVANISKHLQEKDIEVVITHIPNGLRLIDEINHNKSNIHYKAIVNKLSEMASDYGFTFSNPRNSIKEIYLSNSRERTSIILPVNSHNSYGSNKAIAETVHKSSLFKKM